MPWRHYKAFHDSLQLVLYSFFWRRLATGVLAFCSLLPSPPVQWKMCSLTPFIKITLVSSSDVSVPGHGRKLQLCTKLGKGLHLPSFLQNSIFDTNSFLQFSAVLTFKKSTKPTNYKTPLSHYCDELQKQLFVVVPLLRSRTAQRVVLVVSGTIQLLGALQKLKEMVALWQFACYGRVVLIT